MTEIYGAHAIVKCLEREGIEVVFGIPGLYSMPIFDALYRHPSIEVITVRHEQGAAFMADGYARASGRPAAVLTLPGPGVTNAYTGLGEAYYDSSPILLLSTQVNRDAIDQEKGLLHELHQQYEIVAPIMKYSERILEMDDISPTFQRVASELGNGRPRPVQVEIPRDIQVTTMDWTAAMENSSAAQKVRVSAPDQQIDRAAQALREAERPLIYAGGGVISSGASSILQRLAERLAAPVLTTGMGAGAIPGDHDLSCGVAWIAGADIRPLFAASDALLAVGTRFNQGMTHDWSVKLPATTIRIDIDAEEIERNLPMQQKLVGDAQSCLMAIEARLAAWGEDRECRVPQPMAQAQQDFRAALLAKAGSTLPWMNALRGALPRNAVISADMSLFWADMLSAFPIYEPRTMMFPWGYGTLGFAIPEALGAKIALPDRDVIAIAGDGAFLFTGAELATAVQYGLNVPIIVPNNNAYGMIKVQQRDQFDEQFMAVDLVNPDFVNLAKAFGAHGLLVQSPEQMADAIVQAFAAHKPTVIEIPWSWTWGREN